MLAIHVSKQASLLLCNRKRPWELGSDAMHKKLPKGPTNILLFRYKVVSLVKVENLGEIKPVKLLLSSRKEESVSFKFDNWNGIKPKPVLRYVRIFDVVKIGRERRR